MARRGGFPGGGMPGNMSNLMKQAQTHAASDGGERKRTGERRNLQRQQAAER